MYMGSYSKLPDRNLHWYTLDNDTYILREVYMHWTSEWIWTVAKLIYNFIQSPYINVARYTFNWYLNPTIGKALHLAHFASCLTVSAEESRWRVGSHTMCSGSCWAQYRNSLSFSTSVSASSFYTYNLLYKHRL